MYNFIKKTGSKLTQWNIGSDRFYNNSVHVNSSDHCLGKIRSRWSDGEDYKDFFYIDIGVNPYRLHIVN